MVEVQYKKPLPSFLSKRSVEEVASIVAKKFEFNPGDPPELIVDRLGGEVRIGSAQTDEIEGGSIVAKSLRDFVIRISEFTLPKRDRFTVAHELGHLILHLPEVKREAPDAHMRATRWIDDSDADQVRAEWEANWFAAELLMPRKAFKAAVDRNGLSYAADLFNVSISAAKVRAKSI